MSHGRLMITVEGDIQLHPYFQKTHVGSMFLDFDFWNEFPDQCVRRRRPTNFDELGSSDWWGISDIETIGLLAADTQQRVFLTNRKIMVFYY